MLVRVNPNPDSLDARLFSSVVLAVAPAVTIDEALFTLQRGFTRDSSNSTSTSTSASIPSSSRVKGLTPLRTGK